MSLNKLFNKEQGIELGFEIGCATLACENMECKTIVMEVGGDIDAHDVSVTNKLSVDTITDIGGNNYVTPNLGVANYSLHTDGNGATFWAPDDTGGVGGIVYGGIPPTISGQLALFNDTAGGSARQSLITDDGTNLNLNDENLTNVKSASIETLKIVDVLDADKFEIKYDGSKTLFNGGSSNAQITINEDIDVEVLYDLNVVGMLSADDAEIDTFNSKTVNILQQDSKTPEIEWSISADLLTDDLKLKNKLNEEILSVDQSDKVVLIATDGEIIPANWALGASLIVGGYGTDFATLGMISNPTTGYTIIRMGEANNTPRGSITYFNGNDTMGLITDGSVKLNLGPIVECFAPFKTDGIDSRTSSTLTIGDTNSTKIDISKIGVETEIKGNLTVGEIASFSSGSEASPSITFSSDLDTGLYNPSPNDLDIVTNGTSRMRINEEKIIVQDDCNIQLGSTSDITTTKGVTVILKSDGIIFNGAVLKIVNIGGTPRVTPVLPADLDSVSVIGVSASSTSGDNEDIEVVIGGIFKAIIAVGNTVNIGDPLEKSDVNIGRIQSSTVSPGTFGIALSAGTGTVAGDITVSPTFYYWDIYWI